MDTQAATPFWLDKSLWLTVFGLVIAALNKKLGLELDATELVGLLLPIAAYAWSSKAKQAKIIVAEVNARATATATATPATSPAAALVEAGK